MYVCQSTGRAGSPPCAGAAGCTSVKTRTFSGNSARNGGGIFFFDNGSLVMENSTVSGNASTGIFTGGGGVYFNGAARPTPPPGFTPNTLLVRNSTVSNNTSTRGGGGIVSLNFIGTLVLQNSTVSGNTAAESGGGVLLTGANGTGSFSGVDSTITNNTAYTGVAGINARVLDIGNSIVAGNREAFSGQPSDIAATVTHSNGHNIFGSAVAGSVPGGDLESIAAGLVFASVDPVMGGVDR